MLCGPTVVFLYMFHLVVASMDMERLPVIVEQKPIRMLINNVKKEISKGVRMNQIMRHTLGLFHGQTGSSFWKRYLSENMCVRDADVKKIDHIMDKVKLAPQAHTVG